MESSESDKSKKINEYVKLNVGGYLFQTTISTLTSQEGMLKNMFKGDFGNEKDPDGYVLIDRDGEIFAEILNFLRRGSISSARPKKDLENLLAEAEFYQIESLITILKDKLSSIRASILEGPPKIYASSDKDAYLKFKGTSKPVFHLILGDAVNQADSKFVHMAAQIRIFRCLHRKYNDVFLFSLELSSGSDTTWILYQDGQTISSKLSSWRPSEFCPIIGFLAHYLRKEGASGYPVSK